ncbi:MAG: hypothetical protein GY928_12790, partial [Colwellia sp.]|nr:hypothetical protein [Colwellia sp.]
MEAKELRIGNYINLNGLGGVKRAIVTGTGYNKQDKEIVYYSPYREGKGLGKGLSVLHSLIIYAEPIPLTEQWLIDFGFKEHLSKEYKNNWLAIRIMNDDWNIAQWRGGNINYDLRYVHQLQNLFYCLT